MAVPRSILARTTIILTLLQLAAAGAEPARARVPEYKKEIIRKVFDDIVDAVHEDPSASRPRLVIDEEGDGTGAYNEMERAVHITEELFDMCRQFQEDSANALAVVIAHELAHHYIKRRGNTTSRHPRTKQRIGTLTGEEIIAAESKADYLGGIYARMAGYDALCVTAPVLEMIYSRYSPADGAPGYLSLAERKALALGIRKRLERLLPTFDMATCMLLVRDYAKALICYDHIVEEFPSRELLNNAGVAYTLQALTMMDGEDVQYVYPLELDADTRLRGIKIDHGMIDRGTRSPTPSQRIEIRRLLDSARKRFTVSGSRDRRYAPALVNLATIEILDHRYETAIKLANEVIARLPDTGSTTRFLAITVLSIAQMRSGAAGQARENLGKIRLKAPLVDLDALVDANLAVMEGASLYLPPPMGDWSTERIDGLNPREAPIMRHAEITDTIGGDDRLIVRFLDDPEYGALRAEKDSSWVQCIYTRFRYGESSSGGIRIGSTASDLSRSYGELPRMVNARQGKYYIYDASKIMFLVGPDGTVRQWIIYATG